ncbi:MAG: CMP deaminase [Gemmatimonadetes bacterium]|nr:CMP deaminase [Gemmatimonadota bacterium]NNM05889.1 CMP deaminase [Gemmatimonadota bacterium]
MPTLHKDGIPENTHYLNLVSDATEETVTGHEVDRIPLYEVYMRMADELAKRSTCARLQVGTVITDGALEHVVALGYNGNARGFPNRCDSQTPGACGCIHSEQNAVVKADGHLREKVAFVTASPCVMCAKLLIQANVTHVFYRDPYRKADGLEVLQAGGVQTVHYVRWKDAWR